MDLLNYSFWKKLFCRSVGISFYFNARLSAQASIRAASENLSPIFKNDSPLSRGIRQNIFTITDFFSPARREERPTDFH